ncbi:MAG: glutamate racemase [Christensenellales bacterium]
MSDINVNNPIGFFDSGLGGLSLLKEAAKLLPSEHLIYYGDNKNAPYGPKTEDEILRLTLNSVDILLSRNIKALVLACNTATSAAAAHLRERLSIPVIGIEPALKPAYESRRGGQIIVMATNATLNQEKFRVLMGKYGKDAVCVAGNGLVELIESGIFEGEEIRELLQGILGRSLEKKTDFIVLGCTHYPFIKDEIARVAGPDVQIIDGAAGTIRHLKNVLAENGLLKENGKGKMELLSSGEGENSIRLMKMLLER